MKSIYIVLSYSGTIPSKLIKLFTHYEYSHVAISLEKSINTMYSFGRKKVYNPFDGGFIVEEKNGIFYKRFKKTKCIILELEVEHKKYLELKKILKIYKENQDIYKYDIIGLVPRIINVKINRKNHEVCSEFVAKLLRDSSIYDFEKKVIKPIDFMNIPNKRIVYEGSLNKY